MRRGDSDESASCNVQALRGSRRLGRDGRRVREAAGELTGCAQCAVSKGWCRCR